MTQGNGQQQQQKRRGGPQTDAGKLAVRNNAVRHGLLAAELVLPALGESQDQLDTLREEIWRQWDPQGIAEEMQAELVLVAYWRLRRVIVAEGGVLTQRVSAVLRRLMESRRAPADPPPGVPRYTAALTEPEEAALSAAQLPSAEDVERVARYEGHLGRGLSRAMADLTILQMHRKAVEERNGRGTPRREGRADAVAGE